MNYDVYLISSDHFSLFKGHAGVPGVDGVPGINGDQVKRSILHIPSRVLVLYMCFFFKKLRLYKCNAQPHLK